VTERNAIQRQLIAQKEELERVNRYKDEFLANMSHELRTPLTSVLGAADLLKSGKVGGRKSHFLTMIARNSKHLMRLVGDMLDLSQIQSGQLRLSPAKHSLFGILDHAAGAIQPTAERTQVSVRVESETDVYVWADPTRVVQILNNLLSNAVKFTPKGGHVTVAWEDLGQFCEIRVADTGIGIPPTEWPRIFARFEQVTPPVHDDMPKGVGLGLAITRSLVELQGGRLGLESAEGKGTTFWFTLPTAPPDEAPAELPEIEPATAGESEDDETPAIEGVRTLVIEDDTEIAEMLEMFLESEDAIASVAATGADGLRMARETRPDVILLDMRLPDTDGCSLASELRADSRASEAPIIALTAQAMAGDRDKCIQAGCTDYVSKPIDFDILRRAIAKALKT